MFLGHFSGAIFLMSSWSFSMIHLEDLSAIHSQGNLSDCALHAVGALGAYRRRWSHDGHSAAVMTFSPLPCFSSCVCLINESFTMSKIFSRRERCGILKSKWFRVILNAFGVYIYTYTLIDFHQIGFPGATFWGVEVTQDRPKRRKLASGLRRRSERFTSATSGEKNWKFLKNFSRSKMQAGRSYFCDGSNSFFFDFFFGDLKDRSQRGRWW